MASNTNTTPQGGLVKITSALIDGLQDVKQAAIQGDTEALTEAASKVQFLGSIWHQVMAAQLHPEHASAYMPLQDRASV